MPEVKEVAAEINWRTYFDWVAVVNLRRRSDRWKAFLERLETVDWPFREPERFEAVDGELTGFPPWFKQGKGAWGCAMSHVRIMETALTRGYRRVLHLEDDAVFAPDFGERVRLYLAALPEGWGQAYLGGQLLKKGKNPPTLVAPGVYRPFNVNRTHAFALQGEFIGELYRFMMDGVHWLEWPRHHIDHRMGLYQETHPDAQVYIPQRWLMGQAQGHSNIRGAEVPERFWDGDLGQAAGEVMEPHPIPPPREPVPDASVAVMGLFRGGTSCVAGVLRTLGVHMGVQFPKPNAANPQGFWEAVALRRLCIRTTGDRPIIRVPEAELREELRKWITGRRREALRQGTIAGGKHPSLTIMGHLLEDAWPNLKVVSVHRSPEEAAKSVDSLGWWPRRDSLGDLQKMESIREEWLSQTKVPVLRVDFHQLRADPRRVVGEMAAFLGFPGEGEEFEKAVAYVDPLP